jgi:cell division protein FtsL
MEIKERGFGFLSLLIAIAIIAIIIAFSGYYKYGYVKNYQINKEIKENLIKETERVKNQETENLKNQIEESEK